MASKGCYRDPLIAREEPPAYTPRARESIDSALVPGSSCFRWRGLASFGNLMGFRLGRCARGLGPAKSFGFELARLAHISRIGAVEHRDAKY